MSFLARFVRQLRPGLVDSGANDPVARAVTVMMKAGNSARCSSTAARQSLARVVSDRHLATGDPLPELSEGSALRLFSMKLSPFTQRVRMVLFAKGICYDEIDCNLRLKPEFLVERNPVGKVPVLEKDGQLVTESSAICELLEELYPDPPLYPRDPFAKARDRASVEVYMQKVWKHMITAMESLGEDKKAVYLVTKYLREFEVDLVGRGTPFFGGQEPGMVDFLVWPFTERFMLLAESIYTQVTASVPAFAEYVRRMESTPVVRATISSKDHHMRFIIGQKTREYVYDFPDSPEGGASKL